MITGNGEAASRCTSITRTKASARPLPQTGWALHKAHQLAPNVVAPADDYGEEVCDDYGWAYYNPERAVEPLAEALELVRSIDAPHREAEIEAELASVVSGG